MKKEYIPIYKIAGKIQYLTEVLPQIETNTILCKTLTGLGATYSEIKAKRHSVIIVPNVPPIIGKCFIKSKGDSFVLLSFISIILLKSYIAKVR